MATQAGVLKVAQIVAESDDDQGGESWDTWEDDGGRWEPGPDPVTEPTPTQPEVAPSIPVAPSNLDLVTWRDPTAKV
jgi:hypothetical protein